MSPILQYNITSFISFEPSDMSRDDRRVRTKHTRKVHRVIMEWEFVDGFDQLELKIRENWSSWCTPVRDG